MISYSKSLKILYNWENFKKISHGEGDFFRGGDWGEFAGPVTCPFTWLYPPCFNSLTAGVRVHCWTRNCGIYRTNAFMHVYIIIWIKELPVFRKKTTKIHGVNTKYMEMINYLRCYFNIHICNILYLSKVF